MDDVSVNPTTKKLLEAYGSVPSHGLLLHGAVGIGLATLANELAKRLVSHPTDVAFVTPDEKGTIPIERVRNLYIETRDVRTTRQVIVVDDIDSMSIDAQNAFLKLLEEPNKNVLFILTTHAPGLLLETIRSRVQTIDVQPVDAVDSQSLLRKHHVTDTKVMQQMLFLANGLPAELTRLAKNPDYFAEKAELVRRARDFLSAKSYERLVIVSRIQDRPAAIAFTTVLANLLSVAGNKQADALKQESVAAVETTMERLLSNGHVRTQLLNLALSI